MDRKVVRERNLAKTLREKLVFDRHGRANREEPNEDFFILITICHFDINETAHRLPVEILVDNRRWTDNFWTHAIVKRMGGCGGSGKPIRAVAGQSKRFIGC